MIPTPLSRFRRFARAATTELGALDGSFLGRGRPLGAARALNAIGHGRGDVAETRAFLGLDSGLMSRLLRGLEAEGLITVSPHPDDARRRVAALTEAGRREFAAYEALSDARAEVALARAPDPEALLDALDLVATAFGRDRVEIVEADPRGAEARWCLERYYAELASRFTGGFDVALSRDPEAADMAPPRGAFLLALSDGHPLGCVGLKGGGGETGEIKRLWIAPSARRIGLATRLMAAAETQARRRAMTRLRLDTNSALPEARRLYEALGWREIARFNDDPYPDLFFEKTL